MNMLSINDSDDVDYTNYALSQISDISLKSIREFPSTGEDAIHLYKLIVKNVVESLDIGVIEMATKRFNWFMENSYDSDSFKCYYSGDTTTGGFIRYRNGIPVSRWMVS